MTPNYTLERSVTALSVMKIGRVVGGWLLVVAAVAFSETITAAPKSGELAPPHLGTTLEGKPILATDYPGKAVIVSYWATWCSFCLKELDTLNNIQKAASDRVQVVTVNIDSVNVFKKVAKVLSPFKILVLYDPDRKGRKAYGVNGIPHMIIIGKDGKIDTVRIGYTEKDLDDIVDSINRAIGAIPPT
jgi:thiol-disulfide isomerase/thioredoxin